MSQEREEEDGLDAAKAFDPRRVNVTAIYKSWKARVEQLSVSLESAARQSSDPAVRCYAGELYQARMIVDHLESGNV